MLEEQGVVVAVGNDAVWVETRRGSACGHCAGNASCETGVLAGLFKARPQRFKIATRHNVAIGDVVRIGLAEQALVRSSMLVYLLPLFGLFLAAMGYENLAGGLLPAGEGYTALAGIIGLTAGLWSVKRLQARLTQNTAYQPVLLDKIR